MTIDAYHYEQTERWIRAMAQRIENCPHTEMYSLRPKSLRMSCKDCFFTRAMTAEEIERTK
jgi:hypothetical protein